MGAYDFDSDDVDYIHETASEDEESEDISSLLKYENSSDEFEYIIDAIIEKEKNLKELSSCKSADANDDSKDDDSDDDHGLV
ncbi:hypothetical protein L195_g040355 [Trifolium pratense]|uniref:Uncharacterized protein n=1 Tax=Trifolium pratense TaxID=57577 RepID=A0A2K3M0I2_TRIPR|nr:hypothetical protein L195_g040355 [Trifolium pratense]